MILIGKKVYKLIFLLFFSFYFLNCASYWSHRKNDMKDIFTLGVEKPGYGTGLRIGPLAAGFIFQGGKNSELDDTGIGYGLRGGHFGVYHSRQLMFGLMGGEMFYGGDAPEEALEEAKKTNRVPVLENERDNLKSHKLRYFTFYNDPVKDRRERKKEEYQRAAVEMLIEKTGDEKLRTLLPEPPVKRNGYPVSYLFQLDLYLAVHYGVRVGFNVAELFDFLLGFTGLDILNDDID